MTKWYHILQALGSYAKVKVLVMDQASDFLYKNPETAEVIFSKLYRNVKQNGKVSLLIM